MRIQTTRLRRVPDEFSRGAQAAQVRLRIAQRGFELRIIRLAKHREEARRRIGQRPALRFKELLDSGRAAESLSVIESRVRYEDVRVEVPSHAQLRGFRRNGSRERRANENRHQKGILLHRVHLITTKNFRHQRLRAASDDLNLSDKLL